MREIKFRVWCKKENKMIENVDLCGGEAMLINFGSCDHYKKPTRAWNGEAEYIYGPLMQFTGLKDKNGTEIYEGDIVKWHRAYVGDRTEKVEWVYVSFYPFGRPGTEVYRDYPPNPKYCEVIGNIYENEDLLKT